MHSLLLNPARLLRARDLPLSPAAWRVRELVALVALFGAAYGAVMGTFGGAADGRWLQIVYSGVKVPLLLLATFFMSLPSFFVSNTLLGARGDFPHALRALAATQAALTLVLATLAPFTAVWYASSGDYQQAVLFNAGMFAAASAAAQFVLRRLYRPLDRPQPAAPRAAAGVARRLRVRRHPDGLGPPPVRRRPRPDDRVLPRRGVGQRLHRRRPPRVGIGLRVSRFTRRPRRTDD